MIVYLYFKDKQNCEFFFLNVKCFLKNIQVKKFFFLNLMPNTGQNYPSLNF
jgi:hypothetical protein